MNCRVCALYINKAAEKEWEGEKGGGEGGDHNDKTKICSHSVH